MLAVAVAGIADDVDLAGRASPARNSPIAPGCGRTARAPTSAGSAPASPRCRRRARRGRASRTPRRGSPSSARRMVTSLPSGVITRGARISRRACDSVGDVEMIVVAVRHQHDVDRRQRVERDAGVVAALRPGPARPARRAPTTPDRPGCSARAVWISQLAWPTNDKPHPVAGRPAPAGCRHAGSAPIPARPAAAGRGRTASAARREATSAARHRDRKTAFRRNDRKAARHRTYQRGSWL